MTFGIAYQIVGKADCPYFARAERLAQMLKSSMQLNDREIRVEMISPSEWSARYASYIRQYGFQAFASKVEQQHRLDCVLVWNHATLRLVGGEREFRKEVENKYDLTIDIDWGLLQAIARENMQLFYAKQLHDQRAIQRQKLCVLIHGPPASGKSTQAQLLKSKFNLAHISTGALLREAMNSGSELGRLCAPYVEKGQLVPDAVIIALVKQEIDKIEAHNATPTPTASSTPSATPAAAAAVSPVSGYVFDGFPRTLVQANALLDLQLWPHAVLLLHVLPAYQSTFSKALLQQQQQQQQQQQPAGSLLPSSSSSSSSLSSPATGGSGASLVDVDVDAASEESDLLGRFSDHLVTSEVLALEWALYGGRVCHRRIDPLTDHIYHAQLHPPSSGAVQLRLQSRIDDLQPRVFRAKLQHFHQHATDLQRFFDALAQTAATAATTTTTTMAATPVQLHIVDALQSRDAVHTALADVVVTCQELIAAQQVQATKTLQHLQQQQAAAAPSTSSSSSSSSSSSFQAQSLPSSYSQPPSVSASASTSQAQQQRQQQQQQFAPAPALVDTQAQVEEKIRHLKLSSLKHQSLTANANLIHQLNMNGNTGGGPLSPRSANSQQSAAKRASVTASTVAPATAATTATTTTASATVASSAAAAASTAVSAKGEGSPAATAGAAAGGSGDSDAFDWSTSAGYRPRGRELSIAGGSIRLYTVGHNRQHVLVLYPDIFGYEVLSLRQLADYYATLGYTVYIPNLFYDVMTPLTATTAATIAASSSVACGNIDLEELPHWFERNPYEHAFYVSQQLLLYIHELHTTPTPLSEGDAEGEGAGEDSLVSIQLQGFCYGAKLVLKHLSLQEHLPIQQPPASASAAAAASAATSTSLTLLPYVPYLLSGVVCTPSFLDERDGEHLFKPVLFLAAAPADTDPLWPATQRHALQQILADREYNGEIERDSVIVEEFVSVLHGFILHPEQHALPTAQPRSQTQQTQSAAAAANRAIFVQAQRRQAIATAVKWLSKWRTVASEQGGSSRSRSQALLQRLYAAAQRQHAQDVQEQLQLYEAQAEQRAAEEAEAQRRRQQQLAQQHAQAQAALTVTDVQPIAPPPAHAAAAGGGGVGVGEELLARLVVFGLSNSGKTSLIHLLQTGEAPTAATAKPTLHLQWYDVEYDSMVYQLLDSGGQSAFQRIWPQQVCTLLKKPTSTSAVPAQLDAIVFVIDTSNERQLVLGMQALVDLLQSLLAPQQQQQQQQQLTATTLPPVLIYANKSDVTALSEEHILHKLDVDRALVSASAVGQQQPHINFHVQLCSARENDGVLEGMEWVHTQWKLKKGIPIEQHE